MFRGKSHIKINKGQALVEILVAFAIGAIVIDVVVSSVAVVLKSNIQVKNFQTASAFGQELIDRTRAIAEAKWNDIYNLSLKGTSTNYFVIASGTGLAVIPGKEGILGNDVRNGLVGNWKLDEATGTIAYDSSGNSNYGTVNTGTSTINRLAGKVSDAINFDGADDYVNVANNNKLNFGTSSFSYGAWFNIETFLPANGEENTVLSKRNIIAGTNAGYDFHIFSTSLLHPAVSDGITRIDAPAVSINFNQWYFGIVVVARSLNQLQFYLDGVQRTIVDISSLGSVSSPYPLTFGGLSNGTGYLKSKIDDIRIYNRALSAAEIKQLYDSGVFTRFFNVENVNRLGDDISTSGGSDDPSTQKITSHVQWTAIDKTPEVKIATYLTRWRNFVFHQTDWSGGSGQDGPFTVPGNVFSTSTNTDYTNTPGSLKVQGF